MNDKIFEHMTQPGLDEAISSGSYKATLKLTCLEDKFKVSFTGTDETPHGFLFVATEVMHEALKAFSKEYDLSYKDSVEFMIGTLGEFHTADLEYEKKNGGSK